MKESMFKSYDEMPLFLNAEMVAKAESEYRAASAYRMEKTR